MTSEPVPAESTVGSVLAAARARLSANAADASLDANLLLAHASGRDRAWLLAHHDDSLAPEVLERFAAALERRAQGEPVAYITGEAWFYGRRFAVSPDVLVPRPESEELLEVALSFLDQRIVERAARVCDVGTGSGVLAISLACERAELALTAFDISPAALALARVNALAHGVRARVDFRRGDLLEGYVDAPGFDCVIANLPYVRSGDLAAAPDPTSFEPRLALDGGPDGLDLYRRLLAQVPQHLRPGGALFMEAGPDSAEALCALASAALGRENCAVLRDYSGRARIVAAGAGGSGELPRRK